MGEKKALIQNIYNAYINKKCMIENQTKIEHKVVIIPQYNFQIINDKKRFHTLGDERNETIVFNTH